MQVLKKHPIAIIFLIVHTLVCVQTLRVSMVVHERMEANPDMSGIQAGGEWGGVLLVFEASIFSLVSCGYAIGSRTETKFYLWLVFIIIVETITTIKIA